MAPMAKPDFEIRIDADKAVHDLGQVAAKLEDVAVAQTRSGLRTTEFLVSAATIALTICTALAEVLKDRTDHISTAIVTAAAMIAAALTALGYSASRAKTKAAATLAAASMAAHSPGAVPIAEIPVPGI